MFDNVNHSFSTVNVRFHNVIHLKFGPIMAVVSLKSIRKGEELLALYGYTSETNDPRCYAIAYEKEMKRPWPGEFKTIYL